MSVTGKHPVHIFLINDCYFWDGWDMCDVTTHIHEDIYRQSLPLWTCVNPRFQRSLQAVYPSYIPFACSVSFIVLISRHLRTLEMRGDHN